MAWSRRLTLLVLATAALAGCGKTSNPASSTMSRALADNQPSTFKPVVAQPASGSPKDVGASLLAMMRANFAKCKGVGAEIRSYSQGHYKAGEKVTELRESTTTAKMIWARPNKLRLEVETTTNPLLEGAALATPDGQQITARAKGILGLIPFHFGPTAPELRSNRNYPFTENNPKAHIERITGATAVWTYVADSMVETTPVKMVQVDGVKRLDGAITREVVAIDPTGGTLRAEVMYAGNTRVVDFHFLSFRWDPTVSDSMFNL